MPQDGVLSPTSAGFAADGPARLQRLEAPLEQRERQLADAFRIARLGMWRWIAATDEVIWSEEVYRAFGQDPGVPPPGYAVIRALHTPECGAQLDALVARCLQDGQPYEQDVELKLPNGEMRWLISRGQAVARGPDGRVTELGGTIQDITERKTVEVRLRERERELLDMQRIAQTGSWKWMAATGELTWSEEMYRLMERDTRQVQPSLEAYREMFAPGHWEAVRAAFDRMAAGEPRFSLECRLQLPSGAVRWVMLQAEAVRGGDGGFREIRGTMRDMTERMLQIEALAESESRFRKLYEANMVGICYPDRFGLFSGGNDEFLRIVGYTREELEAGKVRWDSMTPVKYAAVDAEHIAEAAERGSCTPYEKEYVRKDGSLVPILCGYALREGSTDEYVGFIIDLTPQKRAEQAIREREARFRELAESLPELIWVSESSGRVTYVNEHFLQYVGVTREEALGEEMFHIIYPEEMERAEQMWRRALETGQPYVNEVRLRRHDGEYRTFLARAVAVRNEQGEIERWLGTATDVHDQKIAEEAVRRTEKLAVTGRLAASMAHEINNPLSAVTNSLYLALMDRGLSHETRQYLEQAEQELARVAAVTTQTLRFHRQSSGPELADVGELLDSALGLFAGRLAARAIAVQREYRACSPLFCNADELRQVLANLLSNARDATPSGGRLRLRVREACAPKSRLRGLRVTVADTGEGIPERVRHAITEPFMTTKEATGTGLGLWVSEGIVKKHKGMMRWRSRTEPERSGTVFALFFPFDGIEGTAGGRVRVH